MYADRYGKTGIKPGALTIAVGLNGAVIAALIFSSPEIVTRLVDPPLDTINIPLPADPPPIPERQPETDVRTRPHATVPQPARNPATFDPIKPDGGDLLPIGTTGFDGGVTGGIGTVIEPYVPPHVPVLTGVQLDPAYARFFQPPYPPSEMRAGQQGRVTVRVLVGIDGRVKQVESVSATSDRFFDATRRQALSKWRFKPAMRDGVPEEGWRTMSVSFVIDGGD